MRAFTVPFYDVMSANSVNDLPSDNDSPAAAAAGEKEIHVDVSEELVAAAAAAADTDSSDSGGGGGSSVGPTDVRRHQDLKMRSELHNVPNTPFSNSNKGRADTCVYVMFSFTHNDLLCV